MPPFPGAQTTSVTFSLRFTAQASACSRPPEPKIKTFMGDFLLSMCRRFGLTLKGYLSKVGLGSQTPSNPVLEHGSAYTGARRAGLGSPGCQESRPVVERRIKPYLQEKAEEARRADQTRVYRRNQVIGLVLVAVAILIFWLFRTNPKWIFPAGWWRL
jgi:hypothetical protein